MRDLRSSIPVSRDVIAKMSEEQKTVLRRHMQEPWTFQDETYWLDDCDEVSDILDAVKE